MPEAGVSRTRTGKSKSSGGKKKSSAPASGPRNNSLFEELRQWRFKKAKAKRVPAYMIFNDATLDELARIKPCTEEELLNIKGIGPSKARKLGKETLAIIAENTGDTPETLPARKPTEPAEELSLEIVEDDTWAEEEFNG
jgi:ATP-dependent DNA helicase RecQ